MGKPQWSDLDFENRARILNLPDGMLPQHPATMAQLNSAVEGLSYKDSTRVRSTVNVTLSSPGASIDGVAMAANDRVLVSAQTLPAQNGIYIWNSAATPMVRSLDASTFAELEAAFVSVEEGASAGVTFRQTQVNGTLETDPVLFVSFGVAAPPASETMSGIAELATQGEVDAGVDDLRIVTSQKLANYVYRKLKYAADVGDGAATSYVITHNLGTRDLTHSVQENTGSRRVVGYECQMTSINSVTLVFAAAPASNALRVVILG